MYGDEVLRREAKIRIAYDEEYLYLQAEIPEKALTIQPELAPDDIAFWRQDHIEFRIQPDPADSARQYQFIFVPDGRFFDSQGLWQRRDDPARPVCQGQIAADRWSIHCRIPLAACSLPALAPGMVIRALAAHSRWANGSLDAACSSAAEIGFQQAERFTELVVAEEHPVRLASIAFPATSLQLGNNIATVTMQNIGKSARSGAILVTHDPDPRQVGACARYPVTLPPGLTALSVRIRLERPAFTSLRLAFQHDGVDELGTVSLRAGVPEVEPSDYRHLRHPYLCYTPDALAAYQQRLADVPSLAEEELSTEDFPAAGDPMPARFVAQDGGAWLLQKAVQAFKRWQDTGDARLIAHATRCLRAAAPRLVLGRYIDLRDSNLAHQLALAYDAFAVYLNADDRAVWVQVLERFLDMHLAGGRERAWCCTTVPNANPVNNGAGGLLALALLQERQEKAVLSLHYARKYIRTFLDFCEGENGGNTEGVQYWEYGFGAFLLFARDAGARAGIDDGFFTHPAVRQCREYDSPGPVQ